MYIYVYVKAELLKMSEDAKVSEKTSSGITEY